MRFLEIFYSLFIVLKGPRRIGKRRLLEEFGHCFKKTFTFSGLPPVEKTTKNSQKEEFSGQLRRQITSTSLIQSNDWSDLFWQLESHIGQDSTLVILDEISWMGSCDLYFRKNDKLVFAICGSSSAWIDKNILSSTGFLGRESLTLTLEELPLCDCSEFSNFEKKSISS